MRNGDVELNTARAEQPGVTNRGQRVFVAGAAEARAAMTDDGNARQQIQASRTGSSERHDTVADAHLDPGPVGGRKHLRRDLLRGSAAGVNAVPRAPIEA